LIEWVCSAHYQHFDEDLPYWMELARQQGGPLLELGCGSGRVMLHLAGAGYTAFGLEIDPAMLHVFQHMLGVARRQHPEMHATALRGDMTGFHLSQSFPLILLPCNTYSMLSAPERQSALACIAQHLAPDGLFALSMPNPDYLRQLARHADPEVEETFSHPLDGEPVQVSSAWDRTAKLFTLYWHYDHLLPDGRVERLTAIARHQIVPAARHIEEFQSASLQVLDTLGDFDGSPLDAESPNLIITARRG
jgi:SAM-dependent methyltransferase